MTDSTKPAAKPATKSSAKSKYNLAESEFGVLTSPKYLYSQCYPAGKPLDEEAEDLPSYYYFVTTYLNILILIMLGHVRDFLAKVFNHSDFSKEVNGYAPLTSDFESFYVRRLKQRMGDCFARPTVDVPGRFIEVFERYGLDDFFNSYKYTGKLLSCLNLSSYNYLGFAQSVGQCTDHAERSITENGTISTGPRATGGTSQMHRDTEDLIAKFVGKESALIYSMGYATNGNVFSALVDKGCLVISDELNHASIRFGVRVSGCSVNIFKHNDMRDLERILREAFAQGQPRTHRPWKKIFVVVEALYSMEGTMCNLPELLRLKSLYKFYLFMDEAHSIGAMGPHGRGACDYFSVDPSEVDILMGTLTKSFGATGGYIAADKAIIDRIRLTNMANVYAEAAAPPVLAQIQTSLSTILGEVSPGEGKERLQRLSFNSRYLRLGLHRLGFCIAGMPDSPIIPIMLYNPAKMPAFSRDMLAKKIAVVVVGYPATPLTSSRVRFCLSAALTKEDLDRVLTEIDAEGDKLNMKFSERVSKRTGKKFRWSLEDVLKVNTEDCVKDWSEIDV